MASLKISGKEGFRNFVSLTHTEAEINFQGKKSNGHQGGT
jgi:hypothetical protein